ncbi:MAG: cytochrome c biogenesis protein CcsA [Armatimonadetes bacterium]|nr:cytochrome c biogenesis protein CcsA [Armatimonadota bacterium]
MLDNNQSLRTDTTMPLALRVGLGVWMSAVIIGTFLFVPPAQGFASPDAARMVIFHIPCAIVAVIAYIISAIYAIAFLSKGKIMSDEKSAIAAGLGFLFTALATVTGMIFAQAQWGKTWNWDPKQTSILMLIMVYAAYFTLRSCIPGQIARAKISAAYNILAGLIMPFLVIILPRMLPSLHPKSAHLSPEYQIALACAAIGYIVLFIWMFRLQVRIAEYIMAARRVRIG